MYRIDSETKRIELTRGDVACIRISSLKDDGSNYEFQVGDVVRFKVFKKKGCKNVMLSKDTIVETSGITVDINLTSEDTKIGDIINTHYDYWYEVELNPDVKCQTIIGYELDKITGKPLEKIFRLLPEGGDNK